MEKEEIVFILDKLIERYFEVFGGTPFESEVLDHFKEWVREGDIEEINI